ncbi:MAG TPA: GerAB/ArcD/ProY family transporter [Firmicutes bacterium]|nr:GerAB/ArcD/ProY family transporter [Bacillota bacterium]
MDRGQLHKGQLTSWQMFWLLTIGTTSTVVFVSPSDAYQILGYGGWQLILTSFIISILATLLAVKLGRRFGGSTYVGCSRQALGPTLGFIASGLLASWYTFAAAADSFLLARAMKVSLLIETPLEAIFAVGVLSVIYAVWIGVERFAMFAEVSLLVLIPLIVFLVTSPLKWVEVGNLAPVFTFPIRAYRSPGFWLAAFMLRVHAFLYMLYPSFVNQRKAATISLGAIALAGAFFAVTFAYPVMIFGMPVAKILLWPFWATIRVTRFSGFPVEKLLYFATVAWQVMGTISTSLLVYCASVCLAEMFHLKDYRVSLIMLIPVIIILTVAPRSYTDFHSYWVRAYYLLGWIATIIVPAITLLVAVVSGRRGNSGA